MSISIKGLNHLGLVVDDISVARRWFVDALGLKILEDRGELLFLMAGDDVLAIKTQKMAVAKPEHGNEASSLERSGWQALDHYGFYADSKEAVDHFRDIAVQAGATILKGPYDRSDGRSVYVKDPCGMVCEYLYFRPSTKS